jgi:DNA-binding CsgD family transcriptional regulator
MSADSIGRAREAFERRAWDEAYASYSAATDRSKLDLDDFERQAVAAHLIGRNDSSRDALAEGYREAVRVGDRRRAASFAFWIGHGLLFAGGMSEMAGWLARARQLLAGEGTECVERGYLLVPEGVMALGDGRPEEALRLFEEARAIGERLGDSSLTAMAGHGVGRALIRLGRIREAMAVLDTVIVQVAAGEVSPMVVGDTYCGALEACHEVFDLRRAREWTGALARWCEGQPGLVPHRGPCMVYRAEIMQFHGDWVEAIDEARRACEWLSGDLAPEGPADAFYLIGELHRLRGRYREAEEAYRQASRLGRSPDPGLPLLWLAQGRAGPARAAVRRALAEAAGEPGKRAVLLNADVEIGLALGDAAAARESAAELAEIAERLDAAYLRAAAATAEGSVLLAEGEDAAALAPLRRAWTEWQRIEAPYEAARVRALIGRAYAGLDDDESAAMELDAARWVFERLEAHPALADLEQRASAAQQQPLPGGLTSREVEVLRLIAAGHTNKQIAAALVISEHTVARHVQNMLGKLGCPSRASLAAFAVERGLVPTPNG